MDVPGYQLHECIARNGQRALYRVTHIARQTSHVLHTRTDELRDAELRAYYVEYLQAIQGFRHPGLCEILEIVHRDLDVYWVSPFYPGGSLGDLLGQELRMPRVLQMFKRMCDALELLHANSLVHGDLKPANVVFDQAGEVVLIDGAYLDPLTDSVPYTPGYGAPEVARNGVLHAACDIYGLGMLLLRILGGDLPWREEGSGEPRVRSSSDSLPTLGPQYTSFVSVLEKAVAYDPRDRFQDINQFKQALDRIDIHAVLHTVAVKTDLIATTEVYAVLPPLRTGERTSRNRSRALTRESIAHWFVLVSFGLIGLWVGATAVYELPATKRMLANVGMGENPALVEARHNALALAADPKQNLQSIVAAYESVLSYQPDDVEAANGIQAARLQWEAAFETALAQNELVAAENRLNDLTASFQGDGHLQAMYDELQTRRHALRLQTDALTLLGVAGYKTSASADMALHAFREVLRLYPASVEAARELEVLGTHFATRAAQEIEQGDLQEAMESLSKASLANPNHSELATVRERIQRATTLREEIAGLLLEANSLTNTGRLIEPSDRNAAMLYHRVLTTDPDNDEALLGLSRVSQLVVEEFDLGLDARQFSLLRQKIERAKTVGLFPASIMHMESALASELENIAFAADLIVEAEQLIADGYITEPNDQNALQILKRAREIDPVNTRVTELLYQCEARLREVALDAQDYGLADIATSYTQYANQIAVGSF